VYTHFNLRYGWWNVKSISDLLHKNNFTYFVFSFTSSSFFIALLFFLHRTTAFLGHCLCVRSLVRTMLFSKGPSQTLLSYHVAWRCWFLWITLRYTNGGLFQIRWSRKILNCTISILFYACGISTHGCCCTHPYVWPTRRCMLCANKAVGWLCHTFIDK